MCLFLWVQAQLPELTARLCSQFCFSAHISLHEFSVRDTLFEAVFHSHFKQNTKWKKTKTKKKQKKTSTTNHTKYKLEIQGSAAGTKKILKCSRGTVKVQCDLLCYDGLMACVGSGDVNITKMLQKVPDGDIQSGSHRGNMPHSDRIIIVDSFNCISYFNCWRIACFSSFYNTCSMFLTCWACLWKEHWFTEVPCVTALTCRIQ